MSENRQSRYSNPLVAIYTGLSDLVKRPKPEIDLEDLPPMTGRKVLITGASSGLGFATAVALARRGAEVIMAMRSGIPGKAEEARRESASQQIHAIHLDLLDLEHLERFAEEVRRRFGAIDVFISNAAMVAKKGRNTKYGLDEMFVVNYFAKFVLVNALINKQCLAMGGGAKARIIFVASESHRNAGAVDWQQFGKFEPYGIGKSVEMYGYYKLLLVTMAVELSRRLNRDGLQCPVSALCPGPINSNIAREAPAVFQPLLRLVFQLFFSSPGKASRPLQYLAAAHEAAKRPMDYLFMMNRKPMDPVATDPENGRLLWEHSTQLQYKTLQFP